ncbi:Ribbon-helix-helix domain-containing protein [Acidaminococcus fermentans]|uniref:ribbon-helix-helix domain-containing protein n=1 Tax=Acidaminococcus fermentans TaxID=905 RepID=UPI0008DF4A7E|nr:ribbon-helix-helix domain-containing protein [Acidaminococcus fermentans]SFO83370.1 Ribbon-helix-helix domain-containing protein [Acidaminococcus fermentans]
MTRVKKDGKFLNCFIKREILEQLATYSDDTGIPKTTVVEKALKKYLDEVMKKAE